MIGNPKSEAQSSDIKHSSFVNKAKAEPACQTWIPCVEYQESKMKTILLPRNPSPPLLTPKQLYGSPYSPTPSPKPRPLQPRLMLSITDSGGEGLTPGEISIRVRHPVTDEALQMPRNHQSNPAPSTTLPYICP